MKQRRGWITTILALMLVASGPVGAFAQGTEAESVPTERLQSESEEEMNRERFYPPFPREFLQDRYNHRKHQAHMLSRHLQFGVHVKNYYLLSAEKYAPDTLNDWETAFEERERLLKTWNAWLDENIPEEWAEQRDEWRARLQNLKEQYENGEISAQELREKLLEIAEQKRDRLQDIREDVKEDLRDWRERKAAVYEAFTDAVLSEDADAIASALADCLTLIKEENEYLQTKIDALKTIDGE